VAVASSDEMELMDEPTPPSALDSLLAMEESLEEPWLSTEEITAEPLARALEMPDETAEAAEEAEVPCAEATAPRAMTRRDVQRMLMVCWLMGVVEEYDGMG